MSPLAIERVHNRLERAKQAARALQGKGPFKDTQLAWYDFLMAISSIYSHLEQGAKVSGTSKAWYGRIKHVRKKDELLSYLHHARNTEQYGLAGSMRMDAPVLEHATDETEVGPGQFLIKDEGTNRTIFRATLPKNTELIAVNDERYGDKFEVPTMHLGKPLPAMRISELAELAIVYVEQMIKEAERLT